jgi:hypothetical protein
MTRRSILTGGQAGPIKRGSKEELDASHERRVQTTAAVDHMVEFLPRVFRERAEQRGREAIEAMEGEQPAVPTAAERAGERESLRSMMADAGSAYWKGAQAAQLQARYRELLSEDNATEGP